MNYSADVRIDETALDVEWLEQAPLALKYAEHLVLCNARVRRLEQKKKVARSELILEVNRNPAAVLGKDKPNAADIEAFYRSHPTYKEIVDELLKAQEEAEFAELAKNEICFTRKKALEMLVMLHGQQYFAGPSIPRNLPAEREKKQKAADSKVAQAMRRKG